MVLKIWNYYFCEDVSEYILKLPAYQYVNAHGSRLHVYALAKTRFSANE